MREKTFEAIHVRKGRTAAFREVGKPGQRPLEIYLDDLDEEGQRNMLALGNGARVRVTVRRDSHDQISFSVEPLRSEVEIDEPAVMASSEAVLHLTCAHCGMKREVQVTDLTHVADAGWVGEPGAKVLGKASFKIPEGADTACPVCLRYETRELPDGTL